MDFFGRQDIARRQSWLLLLAFALAILGMGAFIQLVVGGAMMLIGDATSLTQFSTPAVALITIVWTSVIAGCLFRFLDVRGGGAALAKRFGAEPLGTGADKNIEQRLRNIVSEMSVASHVRRPDVFVMRSESSLNAFVVGGFSGNAALVVTKGLLDELDRDELQGVIAHEYAHIANGDLPLNMKLFIVMGGLLAVDEVGDLLTAGRDDSELPIYHPGNLVGLMFKIIGSVGVVSATLIRAAFSRQREFLADSCAVQYTRDPGALASALGAIRDAGITEPLHGQYASEIAHLCFQGGDVKAWWRRLTASHPPIQTRIKIIDPKGSQQRRRKKESRSSQHAVSLNTANNVASLFGGAAISGNTGVVEELDSSYYEEALDGTYNKTEPAADAGQNKKVLGDGAVISHDDDVFLESLTDRAAMMLQDSASCLAVLFAVFAADKSIDRDRYLSAVSFAYNQNFTDQVKHMLEVLQDDLRSQPNSIIEHATKRLRGGVQEENRRRFLKNLERLLIAEGQYNLKTYVTVQLMRDKLDANFPILVDKVNKGRGPAEGTGVKTFDEMGQEFALLLSLVVESSGAEHGQLEADYQRVLRAYTPQNIPRCKSTDEGVIARLQGAFQTLLMQPMPIRTAFVEHCREIIMHDGHVTLDEISLLKMFSASLGCDIAINAQSSAESKRAA